MKKLAFDFFWHQISASIFGYRFFRYFSDFGWILAPILDPPHPTGVARVSNYYNQSGISGIFRYLVDITPRHGQKIDPKSAKIRENRGCLASNFGINFRIQFFPVFFRFWTDFGSHFGCTLVSFSILFACLFLASILHRFYTDLSRLFKCPEQRFRL